MGTDLHGDTQLTESHASSCVKMRGKAVIGEDENINMKPYSIQQLNIHQITSQLFQPVTLNLRRQTESKLYSN